MQPIAVAIKDVVHEVDRAGESAEDEKRGDRTADRRGVGQSLAEQDASEHQQVFRPLGGPQRNEQVQQDGSIRYLASRGIGNRHWGGCAARHLARPRGQTLAEAAKLRIASFSESNVSNTVRSLV